MDLCSTLQIKHQPLSVSVKAINQDNFSIIGLSTECMISHRVRTIWGRLFQVKMTCHQWK